MKQLFRHPYVFGPLAVLFVMAAFTLSYVAVSAQTPPAPTISGLQVQLQQATQANAALVEQLNSANATVRALQAQSVTDVQTIQRMQQQLAPACVAAFERGNPGETLDPQTWKREVKKDESKSTPAAPAAAAPPTP